MRGGVRLQQVLSVAARSPEKRLTLFALLNLGMIESLFSGLMRPSEAVRLFFNAENCLFVRKKLVVKTADEIMSHGVQLPDLFEALPPEEAHREFQRELSTMRSLCLRLLEKGKLVA